MNAKLWFALGLIPALFGGCGSAQLGPKLERSDDFFPLNGAFPVSLKLANVEIKASASISANGTTRTLYVERAGTKLDAEVYQVTTERIAAVSLGLGERFDPPLDLLRFPMNVGEKLSWAGKLIVGGRPIPARATVSTEAVRLELATGPTETVHVDVQLEMTDGSPKPALRKLEFWFAKGKGPIRRDFGSQVREPRLP